MSVPLFTACAYTMERVVEAKDYVVPQGQTLLAEFELRAALVGNTIVGDWAHLDGAKYTHYYNVDGTVAGRWDGKNEYSGEYATRGPIICARYDETETCKTVVKSGNTYYWYELDGTTTGSTFKILFGNPEGFES